MNQAAPDARPLAFLAGLVKLVPVAPLHIDQGLDSFMQLSEAIAKQKRSHEDVVKDLELVGAVVIYFRRAGDDAEDAAAAETAIRQTFVALQTSGSALVQRLLAASAVGLDRHGGKFDIDVGDVMALSHRELADALDRLPRQLNRNIILLADTQCDYWSVKEANAIVDDFKRISKFFAEPKVCIISRCPR